jgi:hypothetical protein
MYRRQVHGRIKLKQESYKVLNAHCAVKVAPCSKKCCYRTLSNERLRLHIRPILLHENLIFTESTRYSVQRFHFLQLMLFFLSRMTGVFLQYSILTL